MRKIKSSFSGKDSFSMVDKNRRLITAHDVARLAGVSQSAVSRTYTKGASVSPATREKVEAAAAALGYRPNLAARSLITRRSNLIAVVVPSMANPFYSAVLEALSQAFELKGYRVLLFSTASNDDSDPILEDVLRYRVEAVILVSSTLSSSFAEECKQTGLPVVLLNRKNDSQTVSSVTSDNVEGGRLTANFLIAGGHQNLAFIAGNDLSSTSRDRELSFTREILSNGLPPPMREIGNFSFDGAIIATRRLLAARQPPDGIFCANDLMAIAALNVATKEFGLTPGKNISIVGFDNIEMARWPLIGLTTYVQPTMSMVQRAVEIVSAQLSESSSAPTDHVITGSLIVRQTARLPSSGLIYVGDETHWRDDPVS
ncbi:LacI family DNA-binding transcriptional regulator [Pseudomonas rhizosphaerae]|uniref:LacI family DNA-binding transcriptional regulator n=1 Tax=Pseudomonas rhizosphaerae TaxID=216142 RepID=UPI002B48C203|nr:LacI family DNA-binding transcriptional regulator [Pseudomonas rhizosphaerae]MEB2870128.1 LacI family DNA-binding transcriptional regulator [Pseudomonas rhizosphaerae]